MDVYLIRHAQTAENGQKRFCGWTDVPVCPDGLTAAAAARALLPMQPKTVFITPLQRTRQTAEVLFPDAALVTVEGIKEMHFGDFEGRTHQELQSTAAYTTWMASNGYGACPNGEDVKQFTLRVAEAFSKLVDDALNSNEPGLTVVAHGGTIMALMQYFAVPKKRHYLEWDVCNCGGWHTVTDAQTWRDGHILRAPTRIGVR